MWGVVFTCLLLCRTSDLPTPKRPATDASRASAAATPGANRPGATPGALKSPLQATPGSMNTQFKARTNVSCRALLESSCESA